MRQSAIHIYKGSQIERCECERAYNDMRWRIIAYHGSTGMMWSESESYHTRTLADMYTYLDEMAEMAATRYTTSTSAIERSCSKSRPAK